MKKEPDTRYECNNATHAMCVKFHSKYQHQSHCCKLLFCETTRVKSHLNYIFELMVQTAEETHVYRSSDEDKAEPL